MEIKGGAKLEATLKELSRKVSKSGTLRVGFLEGKVDPESALPEATIAALNEFGTKTSPPRPFFRGMIEANSPEWGSQLASALRSADMDAEAALAIQGKTMEGQLHDAIIAFKDPPNAPSTIKRKGFDKPLIDKGDMLKAVGSDVK